MATINSFYREHAMEYAVISEDVVVLPSEKEAGVYYEVQCDGMIAVSCECRGFEHRSRCKHLVIVNEYLASTVSKITEIEKGRWFVVNSDTQVWLDADSGMWLFAGPTENAIEIVKDHLEKQSAVKEAEEIVAEAVETEEVTENDIFAVTPEDKVDVVLSNRVALKVAEAKALVTSGAIVNETASKFVNKPVEQSIARGNDIGMLGTLTRSQGFSLLR